MTRFRKQTPKNSGVWKYIEGIESGEADYLIALDTLPPHTEYPSDRIILVRREPDLVRGFDETAVPKTINYRTGFHAASWWITNQYDDLCKRSYKPRSKKVSTVVSPKWGRRNKFIRKVSHLNSIDVYGRQGIESWVGLKNYRQPLINKQDGIEDYKYSIVIENSQQLNYFSEKIVDCLLLLTMPIYWGCPNIGDYFPENSYHLIDLKNPEGIAEIINKPIKQKHIDAMVEARRLILTKYNIWEVIHNAIL